MIDPPELLRPFHHDGSRRFKIASAPTSIPRLADGKSDYRRQLGKLSKQIDQRQQLMYAHDRYSLLLIFQAIDAAGKDGTIRAVMSGINPHGVEVHAFKKPSDHELDHDFLWRTNQCLPPRGRIGIFNRSYYEEVLVVRIHPEIIGEVQRLPPELTADREALWKRRFHDIRALEDYLHHNGTRVVKFFLNVSREEQARRFLKRIDKPSKNWKFSEADFAERKVWPDYQKAFEKAVNATASPHAPWYIIPADHKKTMRLLVAHAVLAHLESFDMHYPESTDERRQALEVYRQELMSQIGDSGALAAATG